MRGRFAAAVDLRVGDYVVHEDHGIDRFAGFETKTVGEVTRDYLELEYRGEDKVFAPTDQLAKISRYVGAGGDAATDSRALGVGVALTRDHPVVHRVVGVELPTEELAVVLLQLASVLTDDLEVNDRLSHALLLSRRIAATE